MASSLPEFELNLKFPFPCVGIYESNFTGIVHGCSTIGSSEINNFILYFPHKCPSNWNFWNIGKFFLSGIFFFENLPLPVIQHIYALKSSKSAT